MIGYQGDQEQAEVDSQVTNLKLLSQGVFLAALALTLPVGLQVGISDCSHHLRKRVGS